MLTTLAQTGQVDGDERFAFGENWQRFLSVLDEERISHARSSLADMLGRESLEGVRMLDAGSGSGIFSLAAVQMGARRVHSFDFDPASVACAQEVKRRFAPRADHWQIERGDVLDRGYLSALGKFELVYSWGVLHHTGQMTAAMDNVARAVDVGGTMFVSIYNDQGIRSSAWLRVKRTYNALPPRLRTPFVVAIIVPREIRQAVKDTIRLHPGTYVRRWSQAKQIRGMSRWHDMVDWCGGYPFEVAKPEAVFDFYRERGFRLDRLKTCGGSLGCNEFVFTRDDALVEADAPRVLETASG